MHLHMCPCPRLKGIGMCTVILNHTSMDATVVKQGNCPEEQPLNFSSLDNFAKAIPSCGLLDIGSPRTGLVLFSDSFTRSVVSSTDTTRIDLLLGKMSKPLAANKPG